MVFTLMVLINLLKMEPYKFGGDTSFEAYVNLDDNEEHGAKYGHTRIFFFGIDPNEEGTKINGVRQSIHLYVVDGALRSDGTHNRDQDYYGRLGFTVDMYKNNERQLGISTGKKSDGTYYYESGKPTHIVVTVTSSGIVKIYIDGYLIKEGQGYGLDNITRKYHYLGSYDDRPTTHPATNFARGWFKHFRIWNNKVLDQNDISKLYDNREELTSVLDNVSKQYNFRKLTNFTDTLALTGTVSHKAKNILFNPNEYVKGNKSSPSDRFLYSDNLISGKQYSPFNGIFNANQNGFKTDRNSSTDKFTIKLDKTYNTKDLYALVVYHMRSYGANSGKQYVKLKKDGVDVEEVAYHDLPTATNDDGKDNDKSYKVKFGQYDNYKDGFSDKPSNNKIIKDGAKFTMIGKAQEHTITTIDKISLKKEFNEIECQVKGRSSWVGELQLWAPNEVSLISKNNKNEYVTNATYDNSLGNRVMGAQSVAYNGSGLAFIANEYKILLRDITNGLNPHKTDNGSLYNSIHNVLHNWELYEDREITPDAGKVYELQKLNNYLKTPLPILLDYQ